MDKSKRIEWLEEQMFYLSMKDRWTQADYDQYNAWHREYIELKKGS